MKKRLLFLGMMSLSAFCQQPPSPEAVLASKHVAMDQAALVRALSNPEPLVRGLAAYELAHMNLPGAAGELTVAVGRERDPLTSFNMFTALRRLKDPLGEKGIRSICSDERATNELRVQAANELVPALGEPCVLSLAKIASDPSVTPIQYAALETLAQVPAREAVALGATSAVVLGLSQAMQSDVALVRHQAADCIALFKAAGTRPQVKAAIHRESDPDTRQALIEALHSLD